MRADPGGVFESDAHRRVAGNLSQPRSLLDLHTFLVANDWQNLPDLESREDVEKVLKSLVKSGHVVDLGRLDAEDVVKTVQSNKQSINLHKDKAKLLQERLSSPRYRGFYEEDLFVLSQKGLDDLQAPLPSELEPPPMEGIRLEQAQREDRELLARDEKRAKLRREDEE